MGFHLQHVNFHGVLGLFALAAPPLPLAGDSDTPGLQGGSVQEVAQGQVPPAWHRHWVSHPSPSLGSRLWVEAQPHLGSQPGITPCSGWHSSASSV